jgi:hypothetical protein
LETRPHERVFSVKAQPPPDEILNGVARVPPHVVYRAFVNETVVLNLDSGQYHGLNPTAGRMLEVLDRTATILEAAALLAEEYEVPAAELEGDLRELCIDLRERGLIEIDPALPA